MRYLDKVTLRLLRCFSAETAHDLAISAMRRKIFAPGRYSTDSTRAILFGHPLPNPLGLAAGFDKNGYLPKVIQDYGFGYVEVGSVTFRGGRGNPKPRMFRIEGDDIMNRMGLNGEPAPLVADRLKNAPQERFAVNIAKTHSPEILGDKAIDDILSSYNLLKGLGLYTVLNVSCPNTAEGKTFETPEAFKELMSAIKSTVYLNPIKPRPLLVKLSPRPVAPDIPAAFSAFKESLEPVLKISLDFEVAGFILCNTWPLVHPKYGKGGASGSRCWEAMLQAVQFTRKFAPTKLIIACGGIHSGIRMAIAEQAGADFFQAYNGFVRGPYSGRNFAADTLKEWSRLSGGSRLVKPPEIIDGCHEEKKCDTCALWD